MYGSPRDSHSFFGGCTAASYDSFEVANSQIVDLHIATLFVFHNNLGRELITVHVRRQFFMGLISAIRSVWCATCLIHKITEPLESISKSRKPQAIMVYIMHYS